MADQAAEGLLSPFLRQRRIGASRPYLTGRVLDVGCGSGALAAWVEPALYVGIERDAASRQQAARHFPQHAFWPALPDDGQKFDTVVSLAVIEHVPDAADFLRLLATHLNDSAAARIVLTTPHPAVDWLHGLGARLGLFSRHANDEHEELLDHARLQAAGAASGLVLVRYGRFLLGANQVAIYRRTPT